MKITTQRDGFTRIEVSGLVLLMPTDDDSMGDDRIEIRCGGTRLWVEVVDDALHVSPSERFSAVD